MKPAYVVLNMYQGQTFNDSITLEDAAGTPLDLTALYDGARMQVRPYTQSPMVILELSTDTDTIRLDDQGNITFNLSAATTASLTTPYDYEQWVYDIELYKGPTIPGEDEVVNRPIMGTIVFWPEVTRDVV